MHINSFEQFYNYNTQADFSVPSCDSTDANIIYSDPQNNFLKSGGTKSQCEQSVTYPVVAGAGDTDGCYDSGNFYSNEDFKVLRNQNLESYKEKIGKLKPYVDDNVYGASGAKAPHVDKDIFLLSFETTNDTGTNIEIKINDTYSIQPVYKASYSEPYRYTIIPDFIKGANITSVSFVTKGNGPFNLKNIKLRHLSKDPDPAKVADPSIRQRFTPRQMVENTEKDLLDITKITPNDASITVSEDNKTITINNGGTYKIPVTHQGINPRLCLLRGLLNNLIKVNKYNYNQKKNNSSSTDNLNKSKIEILTNRKLFEKNEKYNLLKEDRIISSNKRLKYKNLEYNIYLYLILVFIIIQICLIAFIKN